MAVLNYSEIVNGLFYVPQNLWCIDYTEPTIFGIINISIPKHLLKNVLQYKLHFFREQYS